MIILHEKSFGKCWNYHFFFIFIYSHKWVYATNFDLNFIELSTQEESFVKLNWSFISFQERNLAMWSEARIMLRLKFYVSVMVQKQMFGVRE